MKRKNKERKKAKWSVIRAVSKEENSISLALINEYQQKNLLKIFLYYKLNCLKRRQQQAGKFLAFASSHVPRFSIFLSLFFEFN